MQNNAINSLCKGKNAAIFGKGRSGIEAALLLEKCGVKCDFYAESPNEECKIFTAESAKNHALVVYSPAFRPDHKWLQMARDAEATTLCEPDLASLAWQGKIIAITGTNGKTTLTSFLVHALNLAGKKAIAAGNIGTPLCAFCGSQEDSPNTIAVCELSSFQTMDLSAMKPDALIWTNFAPDHLDWHKDMREYFNAKFKIVESLKSEIFIAGKSVEESAKEFGVTLPSFTEILSENGYPQAPVPFDSSMQSNNYAMAESFWKKISLDIEIPRQAAKTFQLPSHRFSKSISINGVDFYNDSKATNAHAAIAALYELGAKGKKLIWIGGGKDKFCELGTLADALAKNASGAVLIGESAQRLAKEIASTLPEGVHICADMSEAVKKAYALAGKGANVLFSPAFSSFGMFSGYAERGKFFENEVLCLKNLK